MVSWKILPFLRAILQGQGFDPSAMGGLLVNQMRFLLQMKHRFPCMFLFSYPKMEGVGKFTEDSVTSSMTSGQETLC